MIKRIGSSKRHKVEYIYILEQMKIYYLKTEKTKGKNKKIGNHS